jgi:hypothetical protein
VRDRTLRGKHLEQRPLLMVGVDFNKASLLATAKTLSGAGVPFETMFGDIGDPETIHNGLCSRFGARGTDDILHVRSFMDHDRPYLEPTDEGISASALEGESDAAYVRSDGAMLTRALTYRSLVEHASSWPSNPSSPEFEPEVGRLPGYVQPSHKPDHSRDPHPHQMRRWASVAGRHGLLLLEVHSLTVSDTAQFRAETTSLHFDALQSWSGQMLLPVQHWQLALAHAGLLPDANLLCYPKGSPYTRITLQRLVPAPCAGFRLATLSDLPQLLELEAQWDAPFLCSSEATLRQRIELEPSGQFLAFGGDGTLLAAIYTQRVASLEVLQHGVSVPARSTGHAASHHSRGPHRLLKAALWARKESPISHLVERLQRRSIACPIR